MNEIDKNKEATAVKYPHLTKAIIEVSTIKKTGADGQPYSFQVFPFGELGVFLGVDLVREIIDGLVEKARPFRKSADYILSITPGGNPWGPLVAYDLRLDWVRASVAKKTPFWNVELEDELKVYVAGPHGRELRTRGINKGDRILVVDDVISSAETVKAVVTKLRQAGAHVSEVFCIVTKGEGYKDLERSLGIRVHSLANLTEDGQLVR